MSREPACLFYVRAGDACANYVEAMWVNIPELFFNATDAHHHGTPQRRTLTYCRMTLTLFVMCTYRTRKSFLGCVTQGA